MYLTIIVNLPAVTVGVGVLVVSAVTREVVNIDVYDIIVVILPTVTVGIGLLVSVEVTREVIGVYDSVVIPAG